MDGTFITELSSPSTKLKILHATQSSFRTVPSLPLLERLWIWWHVTSLPDLPSLILLDMSGNTQLKELPNLPKLTMLICRNTLIDVSSMPPHIKVIQW